MKKNVYHNIIKDEFFIFSRKNKKIYNSNHQNYFNWLDSFSLDSFVADDIIDFAYELNFLNSNLSFVEEAYEFNDDEIYYIPMNLNHNQSFYESSFFVSNLSSLGKDDDLKFKTSLNPYKIKEKLGTKNLNEEIECAVSLDFYSNFKNKYSYSDFSKTLVSFHEKFLDLSKRKESIKNNKNEFIEFCKLQNWQSSVNQRKKSNKLGKKTIGEYFVNCDSTVLENFNYEQLARAIDFQNAGIKKSIQKIENWLNSFSSFVLDEPLAIKENKAVSIENAIKESTDQETINLLINDYLKILDFLHPNDPKKSEMIQMIKKSNKIKNILEKNYFDYEPLILAK